MTLAEPEKKLAATHKDCLEIVCAILPVRPHLEGSRFTVRTYHEALKWLLTTTEATGKLARW